MPASIDLTPFGFTPTETLAYQALLSLGPSSGYAVARELSIARANAYQALDGLTAKEAAERSAGQPRTYRAVRPDALFARVVARQSARLDLLETQVTGHPEGTDEVIVPIAGLRSFVELATRWIVRSASPVDCLAPPSTLTVLVPAWRKRSADGRQTGLWSIGNAPALPVALAGTVPSDDVESRFGTAVVLITCPDVALFAGIDGTAVNGYWSSDRLVVGVVRTAFDHLTGSLRGNSS